MNNFGSIVIVLSLLGVNFVYAEKRIVSSIAISVPDLGNPFFVEVANSAINHARKRLGENVTVVVRSNAYDLKRQERQIDTFIELKIDLIILVAPDQDKVERAVKKAQNAGIKVVAVDVNADGANATVTTNNIQAGRIACEYIAQRLNGAGTVVILNGPPVSSVLDRVYGCKSALKRFKNIDLLSDTISGSGSYEGGMEAMTTLLEYFENIDAVFAINDPTASGADAAIKQSGIKDLFIVSVDGSPLALAEFRKNNSNWVASAAQFPQQMAIDAIDIGIELVSGKEISSAIRLIPASIISSENADQYEDWSNTNHFMLR